MGKLDKEKFRLGHTLVFFRAGIGGWMEEQRENKIGSVLAWLQAGARGKASRMQFKKLQDQKMALYACQRAIRSYMMAKTWLWLQLWLSIKPNLKGQLDDLMGVLYKTHPHFIRCVVPNTHKIPGGVEPGLVMHQYQCNGVLAGIAICRAGFPNKLAYPEFKARYNIIGAAAVAKAKNDKAAAQAVMDIVKLDKEKFRLGHTLVFFRAGIGGWMEEQRVNKIGSVLA